MNLRNFIRLGALAVVSAVGFGCTPENKSGEEKKNLNENLAFTLEVTEVESDKAKIKVEHNGERDDTWYGFATTESNIDEAVLDKIDELLEGKESISGLQKSTSKTVTVRDLEPETDYTFVAFGLTEEGTYYGIPETVEFTTPRDATKLEETDDWSISYERGENEGETAELFTIQCETGKWFYFTTVNKLALEVYEMGVADYVSYVIDYEIPTLLNYGYAITDLIVDQSYRLANYRMESGDYYALAIGFTEEGKATGYYSVQEFQIVEEVATDEYNQWLGTWVFTDSSVNPTTNEPEPISYEITIQHYDNNFMYYVTGWECGSNMAVDFSTAFGTEIGFPASYYDGLLGIEEYGITYLAASENSTEEELYFGLWGWGTLVYNGSTYENTPIGLEGATIALAATEDGQTATLEGQSYKESNIEVTYEKIGYTGISMVEGVYSTYWNEPMTLPITMTKKAEAATQQSFMAPAKMKKSLKAETAKKIKRLPVQTSQPVKMSSL